MEENKELTKFSPKNFNKYFEQEMKNKLTETQNDLHNILVPSPKKIIDFSMLDMLINIKKFWFDLFDSILHKKFNPYFLIENYNLFYLGLSIIFFVMIIILIKN